MVYNPDINQIGLNGGDTVNRIKAIRTAQQMSQKRLSELTGMSQVNISRYETGQRGLEIENAAIIAAALNCTVDDLIEKEPA